MTVDAQTVMIDLDDCYGEIVIVGDVEIVSYFITLTSYTRNVFNRKKRVKTSVTVHAITNDNPLPGPPLVDWVLKGLRGIPKPGDRS